MKDSDVEIPSDYGYHKSVPVEDRDEYTKLLLPRSLLTRMREEALERVMREGAPEAGVQEELDGTRPAHRARRSPASTKPVLPEQPPGTVQVFDWQAALAHVDALKKNPASGDTDVVKRDIRQFEAAMANGPWRLATTPAAWREDLASLRAEMPNFGAVVAHYEHSLALAELTGCPAKPGPVLLLGAPGSGKTHFAQRLAEFLQTVVHRESFDAAQSNSGLRGSERYWSNTAVGALWKLIVQGDRANPVVLLDELDKASRHNPHGDPADALLTLLEPATAHSVRDLSVGFEFDASFTIYVATANDGQLISAALRSRFTEFEIEEPDIDGRLVLAHSIFAATLARMVPDEAQRKAFHRPTDLQICKLAWMTPREIRIATERAIGTAASSKRWHFEDADFGEHQHNRRQIAKPQRRSDDDDDDMLAVIWRDR